MANESQNQAEEIFARGTVIFEEGQPGHNMYFILGGKVEIFRGEGDGKKVLAVLSKGEFFGELALIDAQPRIAGARAVVQHVRDQRANAPGVIGQQIGLLLLVVLMSFAFYNDLSRIFG